MLPSLLYLIAVICSMMSQLPFLIGTSTGTLLKYTWALPLFSLLLSKPNDFFNVSLRPFFLFLIVFAFYCFLMTMVTGITYTGADLYNITLSFAIALTSYVFWKNYASEKFLTALGISLMICAALLAYVVYNTSFVEYDILTQQYVYASKNSLGQILFASLLIGNVILLRKKTFLKLSSITISLLVIYVILVLKSRATFLSILFIIAYFSLSYKKKHIRRLTLVLCFGFALWLITNLASWDTFLNAFIFAGREASDIDNLSSGRLTLISKCLEQFALHPLFGIGNEYVDCFPIIILTQYGLIGASIVFGIIIYSYKLVKKPSDENTIQLLAFLILVSFLINSLFEAHPPFGPGVKCFFVWMMFGFHLAENARIYITK